MSMHFDASLGSQMICDNTDESTKGADGESDLPTFLETLQIYVAKFADSIP